MKKEPVKVSVLFATYNGGKKLARMLEALTHQTLPQSDWKIIAVNNNSTDNTAQILDSYKDKLPIEVYFEAEAGKSKALDLGFRYLDGELIIITDDDVIPNPDWIEQHLNVAADHPDYAMFGGLILPAWEKEPDQWVLDWTDQGILYALNSGFEEGPISPGCVFGPNSAFRRNILPEAYSVNTDVGPKSSTSQYAMGNDTALSMFLASNGAKAWHSCAPVVRHQIPKKYIEEAWMLGRAERYGLGVPILKRDWYQNAVFVGGLPVRTTLKVLVMSALAPLVQKLPKTKARFRFLWSYNLKKGIVKSFWRQSKKNA